MTENLLLYGIIIAYIAILAILGYLGYRNTIVTSDYVVAGRNTNPVIMALSYGAAFISTSAIVGFGGAAGAFGMGLLWLTFLTILVGVFIAFIFFGKRTRSMGKRLKAMTFPDLMGKRYNSSFIHIFCAAVILLFMPLYAGAVLIGAARFLEETLNLDYLTALYVFTAILACYVIIGGLKGVMYSDAFQGTVMFLSMAFLIVFTYAQLGGLTEAHTALVNMSDQVPQSLKAMGHQGWASMPEFGSHLWWVLVSTLVLGVGIGCLAQPQLAVKYMTVPSSTSLNRACLVGGIFILAMTGVAFIVGALSNVYFFQSQEQVAFTAVEGNYDRVLPLYINEFLPAWFSYLFMVALVAAAVSTLSNLFHTMGTALGQDIYDKCFRRDKNNLGSNRQVVFFVRIGIVAGILLSVLLGYKLPIAIIARATAMFFGIAAATFLSIYMLGIFWKGVTKAGAIAGMVAGFSSAIFWLVFVFADVAEPLGICQAVFGTPHLISSHPWPVVDPILIGLPFSMAVTFLTSLFTPSFSKSHVDLCFDGLSR